MKQVVVSENTLLILSEQSIEGDNTRRIYHLTQLLKKTVGDVIIDIIPAYASVHITFNLLAISADVLKKKIQPLIDEVIVSSYSQSLPKKIIEIPTYYGEEVALDLPLLADKTGLSVEKIIRIHTSQIYNVYAIGFAPGFAYLGHVDSRIASPRKHTPRKKVAQGSVGIADRQTAIYPSDSPGGWQIIGRTPSVLIDYGSESLSPFSVGDQVQFVAISRKEYVALGGVLP